MQGARLYLAKQRFLPFFLELKEFLKSLSFYVVNRLGRVFFSFEVVKGAIVSVLYRRRGKYAQPFVHSAMVGLTFAAVTFGPLFIAQTFPGQVASFGDNLPSEVVLNTSTISDPTLVTHISEKPRSEVVDYEVHSGDTVSSIAEKFGVSIDTVLWVNDMGEKDRIKPGQTFKIPPVTGIVHAVRKGDTIYSISKKYEAEAQAIVDFPFNIFTNDETFALAVGQTVIVPDGVKPDVKPVSPVTSIARLRTPDAGVVSATGQFVWPASGRISQRFVWYHRAIDIANKAGGAILATDAGRVVLAGWPDNRGYGNRVILDHGNGYQTLYAHLSRINVSVGQTVSRGDVVGQMGCTGRCSGTHLHFEIHQNGVLVNPLNFLK